MASRLRLDFGNLPLIEAAVRVSFQNDLPLKFTKIYECHERLNDLFGHLSEPTQHEAAPGISESIAISPGVITGVVLDDNDQGMTAVIQKRLVVVRWVKKLVKDAPEYPRFPTLRDTLWNVVDTLGQVSRLDSVPIAVVNMSYVNFIDASDPSKILIDYFSDLVHVKVTDNSERIHQVELSWRRDGIDLRFCLKHIGMNVGDETKEGFQLTTVAGARIGDSNKDPSERLEVVHQRLQDLFRDILSDRARDEWQLTEVK